MTPETALNRLRKLYRDAHHCDPASDDLVLRWAEKPELWAEHQIRFRNWTWYATEATVKLCRQLSRRARLAAQQETAA